MSNIIYKTFGSEVFPEATMKNVIFWHTTPCSPVKVNRRFGGT
jgi:hypothetical protein